MQFDKVKNQAAEIINNLKVENLANCLGVLRRPILKLSEINIEKSSFNQWKREGILDSLFLKNEKKTWNMFSLMDLVVLEITKILWGYNIDDKNIKEVVEILLDGEYDRQINVMMDDEDKGYMNHFGNPSKFDLIQYLVKQKIENPHLPVISTIEAFILGAIKIGTPFCILVYNQKKVAFFVSSHITNMMGGDLLNNILQHSFVNISIKEVVDKILNANVLGESPGKTFTESTYIKKLLEKGYSLDVLNEIFEMRGSIKYTEQTLPTDINIAQVIRENADQDIMIKVREGKKQSIRRLLITKK